LGSFKKLLYQRLDDGEPGKKKATKSLRIERSGVKYLTSAENFPRIEQNNKQGPMMKKSGEEKSRRMPLKS